MKKILLLLLFTVASYGQAVFDEGIQITNTESTTATKVNVQEANGKVNTKTINTAFNKNFGLNTGDVVGATTLLNQYSTTPVDWTATSFSSGQVVFYGGKQWIAKIATVAGDVPAVSPKWEEITFEALANKTVIVDAIPTDGSTNAVSSNGVFDALALKAPISSVHNPVTLGTPNGLSLATQQLSLGLASSGTTGALSDTDWNTFKGKFNTPTGLTTNYLTKWNGSGFGNSIWQEFAGGRLSNTGEDDLTNKLQVDGSGIFKDNLNVAGNYIKQGKRLQKGLVITPAYDGFGNGRTFVRVGSMINSQFISGNIRISGDWLYGPIMGVIEMQVGVYAQQGATNITIGSSTITLSTSYAGINLNISDVTIVDGFIGFYIYSAYANQIYVSFDGTLSDENFTWQNTAWEPFDFPARRSIDFQNNIIASPATTANQVPTWGQVQAVAARPYKVYTALLTQTGTNAPTATVLENTLGGAITWTRNSAGIFYGTLSVGIFTTNKTVKFATLGYTGIIANSTIEVENANTSTISVITRVNGNQKDDVMSMGGTSIEIRIYN